MVSLEALESAEELSVADDARFSSASQQLRISETQQYNEFSRFYSPRLGASSLRGEQQLTEADSQLL